MPVKYHKSNADGKYKPVVDQKHGEEKHWNIKRLSSRENPLVLFTLVTQAAIGCFWIVFVGGLLGVDALKGLFASVMYVPVVAATLGLAALGLFTSTTHLGKPVRFYRGFNNWRHSPVSREGLGVVMFMFFAGLNLLFSLSENTVFQGVFGSSLAGTMTVPALVCGALSVIGGAIGVYYMYRCYRIPARPFWNHWQTASTFLGTAIVLGAFTILLLGVPWLLITGGSAHSLFVALSPAIIAGLVLEGLGLYFHANQQVNAEHEGAVSHYIQRTTFGRSYLLRNSMVGLNALAVCMLAVFGGDSWFALTAGVVLGLSVYASAIIGRALFYVLVVPTTMPGAFFWKNKGFEDHAREIGLAANPAVGVAMHSH